MEHRLEYRDIPWGVAVCVLPGKIIGRLMIDPINHCIKHWKRLLKRAGKILLTLLISTVVIALLFMLVESLTDGDFSKYLLNLWDKVSMLFADTPAPPADGDMP